LRGARSDSFDPEFKTNLMKKAIVAAVVPVLLGVARTAAAQLYTCTGQNDACTLCDFFAMMVNVIGITLKFVVPSAIILAVIAAGVMMMLKQEDPDVWARAKKIMLTAIVGGLVVYGGWLLVSVSLAGMNFTNKDTWWKFELVCTHCGDDVLQAGEECEPGLSEIPCDEFCKIITEKKTINQDLYDTADGGKDLTIIVEKKTVNQDLCDTADGGKDLTDPGASFDIVRAHEFLENRNKGIIIHPFRDAYTCDEVCAVRGQKCIGVGLTNVATNRCVAVRHHVGNICELSGNLQQGSGCSDYYRTMSGMSGMTCLEMSSPCKPEWEPCGTASDGQSYVQFSLSETACYCQ